MADEQVKQRIYEVLKHGYFTGPDDSVFVSDGDGENIHVVVVSARFDGHGMMEKDDIIRNELVNHLEPEEWGKVSLSIGISPEELKAYT